MGCVILFHVLQLAYYGRQARSFILYLDAQISSPPEKSFRPDPIVMWLKNWIYIGSHTNFPIYPAKGILLANPKILIVDEIEALI